MRFYLEERDSLFWFIEGLLFCVCRFPQLGEVLPGGEGW